jgi:hypothetical protein
MSEARHQIQHKVQLDTLMCLEARIVNDVLGHHKRLPGDNRRTYNLALIARLPLPGGHCTLIIERLIVQEA